MTIKKKTGWYVLLLVGSVLVAGATVQAASADKELQKGIEAYQKNDTEKDMDYFVDVLMHGDAQQAAQANQYINAIHNQIGGIRTPVEVGVDFPDQPNQTIVNTAENLANYGTERLDTLATEGEYAVEQTRQALGNPPKSLTEQIEERQLAEYAQQGVEPIVQEKSPAASQVIVPSQNAALAPAVVLEQAQAPAAQTQPAQWEQTQIVSQSQSASSTFADLTTPSAIEARNLYTAQKLQSMTDSMVADLASASGVRLYMRSDGRPDAIDMDESVLFQGNSFRPEALSTLNSVYELAALTQGARFIILPTGSYTDDVTLLGIRRAMALKSYLSKRGISQGKLYYNMGLVDQEVPEQFSDLKGLSIVFDYNAELPTRLLENESHEKAPLLSMAVVPPCRAIDRSIGEAYAVDFSVLETEHTLDNWVLQVVQHGRNGNYYVVRQLEGFSPVYHQILWNGRKGIIGPELPCGKYTLVLSAVDLKGNKQTLRRRLIVKCAADPAPSCQTGRCPITEQEESVGNLNYQAARLWTKPNRTVHHCSSMEGICGVAETKVEVAQPVVHQMSQAQSAQTAQASSVSDSSYTVTKTVRNIVTDDHSVDTVASSSEELAPLPVNAGGYDATAGAYTMPYEEEYSQSTTR